VSTAVGEPGVEEGGDTVEEEEDSSCSKEAFTVSLASGTLIFMSYCSRYMNSLDSVDGKEEKETRESEKRQWKQVWEDATVNNCDKFKRSKKIESTTLTTGVKSDVSRTWSLKVEKNSHVENILHVT
jgi:hypothetical protein